MFILFKICPLLFFTFFCILFMSWPCILSHSSLNASPCHQYFKATNAIFDCIYLVTEENVLQYCEIFLIHSTEYTNTRNTEKLLHSRSCLVSVRLSPRPPKSTHFGDVSETNGLGTRVFARSLSWSAERKTVNKKQRGEARREKAPSPPNYFSRRFSRCSPNWLPGD